VLFVALGAVVSLAVGFTAAGARLWLIVFLLAVGWTRWTSRIVRLRLIEVPRQLASIARDESWKDPDWDPAEEFVHIELLAAAAYNVRTLRRARRRLLRHCDDLGQQTVALDRIDAAIASRDEQADHHSTVRRLATIVVPTSWAVSTGSSAVLLLSDITPGPVLGNPWRTLAGIAAASATGSLVALGHRDRADHT
jgi:hypothetical protein